jgi:hypothetical protein
MSLTFVSDSLLLLKTFLISFICSASFDEFTIGFLFYEKAFSLLAMVFGLKEVRGLEVVEQMLWFKRTELFKTDALVLKELPKTFFSSDKR